MSSESLGLTVLAIKADELPAWVETQGRLAECLNLPAHTADCVGRVAVERKVVVLIDQLDTLAGLVDLRSGRLRVLLDLIDTLADRPNVHLVCSCREFEYNHDG